MPSDRNRRPIEARTLGSSSMTKTVEFASGIAATRIKDLGSRYGPGRAILVVIHGRPRRRTLLHLAHGTINLSMGRLNQHVRPTNPRAIEQSPRLNYHFGHR